MPTAAAAGVPDVPATSSTLGSAFLERPTGASEYYLLDNQQWLSSSENRPMTPFVGRTDSTLDSTSFLLPSLQEKVVVLESMPQLLVAYVYTNE